LYFFLYGINFLINSLGFSHLFWDSYSKFMCPLGITCMGALHYITMFLNIHSIYHSKVGSNFGSLFKVYSTNSNGYEFFISASVCHNTPIYL
jgi:hypothetical protein